MRERLFGVVMNMFKLALPLTLAVMVSGCGPLETVEMVDSCTGEKITFQDELSSMVRKTRPFVPRKLEKNVDFRWSASHAMVRYESELLAVDRDNGTLVVMDLNDGLKVKRTIPVGERPEHVIVTPHGDAWVSVRHGAKIVRIAKGADTVIETVKIGVEPIGMAISPDGGDLFVAVSAEGVVKKVDLATSKVTVFVTGRPGTLRAVQTADDNKTPALYLVDLHRGLRKVDLKTGKMSEGNQALRRNNPAQVVSKFDGRQLNAWRAVGGSIHPERGVATVAHVLVGNDTGGVIHGDGSMSGGDSGGSTYGSGGSSCTSNSPIRPVEVSVTEMFNDSKTAHEFAVADPANGRLFLTRFDQPSDLVFHPTVSLAFMPAYGTDNVLVLNVGAGDVMRFPIAELKAGAAPKAVALSADGQTAYVLNQHGFSVSVIDLTPLTSLAIEKYPPHKNPAQVAPMTLEAKATVVFAKDPLSPEMRRGSRLFTHTINDDIAAAGRFACASCHLEGAEDKLNWDVNTGPRQTPSLAGRLLGTGPFNWTGSEQALKSNMDETIERMGGAGLSKSDLSALEQFLLKGLPERPNPYRGEKLTEQQERGKKLFFDKTVGCGGCHVAGDGSDGLNWDVGTTPSHEQHSAEALGQTSVDKALRFNTPSLRGVWATAPYFHNGSANTLHEALKKTSTTMGRTDHLKPGELDDLVAYLRTL